MHEWCATGDVASIRSVLVLGEDDIDLPNSSGETYLLSACSHSQFSVVDLLLHFGADPNVVCLGDGYSPLHVACDRGSLDIAQLLISHGADVNCLDAQNETPLFWACRSGREDVVALLIEKNADFNINANGGQTVLHVACIASSAEVVKHLIKAGMDLNAKLFGATALYLAVNYGYHTIASLLLEAGADIDCIDSYGNSLLHIVACHITAELLITNGADVTQVNDENLTPLQQIEPTHRSKVVEALVVGGADIEQLSKSKWGDLHHAVYSNDESKVISAFKNTDYAKVTPPGNISPLILAFTLGNRNIVKTLLELLGETCAKDALRHGIKIAIRKGYTELLSLCIEFGGNIHQKDLFGWFLIHEAAATSVEMVKKLVEFEANVDVEGPGGITPLHNASSVEIAKILFENGAEIKQNGAVSVLYKASLQGNSDLVAYLVKQGADVNCQNRDGETPLFAAAKRGHVKVAMILIFFGANIHHCNKEKLNPLVTAKLRHKKKVVSLLVAFGAENKNLFLDDERLAENPMYSPISLRNMCILVAGAANLMDQTLCDMFLNDCII